MKEAIRIALLAEAGVVLAIVFYALALLRVFSWA